MTSCAIFALRSKSIFTFDATRRGDTNETFESFDFMYTKSRLPTCTSGFSFITFTTLTKLRVVTYISGFCSITFTTLTKLGVITCTFGLGSVTFTTLTKLRFAACAFGFGPVTFTTLTKLRVATCTFGFGSITFTTLTKLRVATCTFGFGSITFITLTKLRVATCTFGLDSITFITLTKIGFWCTRFTTCYIVYANWSPLSAIFAHDLSILLLELVLGERLSESFYGSVRLWFCPFSLHFFVSVGFILLSFDSFLLLFLLILDKEHLHLRHGGLLDHFRSTKTLLTKFYEFCKS